MSVQAFNALPRKRLSPSRSVSNNWHFDLRFIYLEPTPSHILFLVQFESSYVHIERLPLGISPRASGMDFFPESAAEAAPEVAKALIQAFVDGLGTRTFNQNPPPAFAPWKLTTDDFQLAAAVADEFKKMGVRDELCRIHVVQGQAFREAQNAFNGFWKQLKAQTGIPGIASEIYVAPESICFHNFRPAVWIRGVDDENVQKAVNYSSRLSNARPLAVEAQSHQVWENTMKEIDSVMELVETKPSDVVRAEADAGDPEAAIDYALRYV
jgi:hypothetical protein